MDYILLFLEGIITFISPCILPLIPIYISYFAYNKSDKTNTNRLYTLLNAFSFTLGFTIIFVLLGAFSSLFGTFLNNYSKLFNIIIGLFMILIALNYLEIIDIKLYKLTKTNNAKTSNLNFISSFLFGLAFSFTFTPCVSSFLGSAILFASRSGSVLKGISMLFTYSLGLSIPFILSALLIDELKSTFDFIKKNYKIINTVSGIILLIIGILILFGKIGILYRL